MSYKFAKYVDISFHVKLALKVSTKWLRKTQYNCTHYRVVVLAQR